MRILSLAVCLTLVASLASAATAQPKIPKPSNRAPTKYMRGKVPPIDSAVMNLRIDVSVKYQNLSDEASFIVGNATQANYTRGGDKHFFVETKQERGVEFKKWGFIVNVLPVVVPDSETVAIQVQLELSGPSGDGEIPDIETWQYQTEVTIPLGKPTPIVLAPAEAVLTVSRYEVE